MPDTQLHRVWFSGNDRTAINHYGLWLPDSKRDLEKLGNELKNGLRVIICEPGELEMEAVLHFDTDFKAWVAVGDEDTIKYL